MFTGEARYGDGLERALYNTILGALDPGDDGNYFYYSDYQSKARKGYYKQKWPCCAGTLLQSVADFPLNLFFQDARGVYVNLYAGSELRWKASGVPVKLTQKTAYPESERVEMRVEAASPVEFALRLRIPGWLEKPAEIAVNEKRAQVEAGRGRFATLSRRWRNGDTVELRLPFPTRVLPIEERSPETVAVLRGPVMLVAVDPPDEMTVAAADIKPVSASPLEFECHTVRMRPFYRVQREPYTTYFTRS
jgi:DUF1680 family protein